MKIAGALYLRENCGSYQIFKEHNMRIGNKEFQTTGNDKKTYVMGILNVTPDSFSDGGNYTSIDAAVKRAEQMLLEGADIIDIGGESTRPGYTIISDEEEIARTAPVIEKLKAQFDVPVSIDTYKGDVAEAALQAGADLVNDIWGLKHDDKIACVIQKHKAACCLMHNREHTGYQDFLPDVKADLEQSLKIATAAGIQKERIMLDPGVGFAKSYEQNLLAIKNMGYFNRLGYPMLLGTSRKSVIGLTLDVPAGERVIGTAVTTVLAAQAGYSFVRVHDVKENVQALKMLAAIVNA